MNDDLDPPSFQFQRAGRRRRRDEGEDPPDRPAREDEGGEVPGEMPSGPIDTSLDPDAPGDATSDILATPAPAPEPSAAARDRPASPEPRVTRASERGREPAPPRRGGRFRGETARRVLWALPWAAFAIAIIAIGGGVFALAIAAITVAGLREFFRMTMATRPLELPAYAAAVAMIAAAYFGESFHVLLAFAASFPAIFAFAASREDREGITVSIAVTVLGIAWLGGAFAHAVLLRELADFGGGLLVDVVIATVAADTAAYAGGRMFGSRKITPSISPNKTLEGMLWGFAGGAAGFWIAGLYQDWLPGIDALLMGIAVGIIAPIGDLFSSMIKRDYGTKDTGRLFGPHGGLLDRLDAITFTVVLGYYLSIAFVY